MKTSAKDIAMLRRLIREAEKAIKSIRSSGFDPALDFTTRNTFEFGDFRVIDKTIRSPYKVYINDPSLLNHIKPK